MMLGRFKLLAFLVIASRSVMAIPTIPEIPEFPDIKVGSGGYVKEEKLLTVVDRIRRLNSTIEIEYLGDYYFRIRKKLCY